MNTQSVHDLSDDQLLNAVKAATTREREATSNVIALLAEVDTRRLYLGQGYSSLFVYCTQRLHLSEHAAYGRIEAARVARKFPLVIELLADGAVTLTTICLLASHLTPDNHRRLLEAATHKSKREVEQQVAALRPSPPIPSTIRKLPQPKPDAPRTTPVARACDTPAPSPIPNVAESLAAPAPRVPPTVIRAIAPERYKVQLTISRETHEKLRKVQDLLRHVVPNGDPAVIFERALTLLLQELERRRLAKTDRPQTDRAPYPHGRHVPAAVRRTVWDRDGGQCAFVGAHERCSERGFLEFHHVVPYAEGGATTADNLQLRCRAHNAYEAREHFGVSLLRERFTGDELGPEPAGFAASCDGHARDAHYSP